MQQKVGEMGQRGTEFATGQGFFHGKGEDRQRVVVADYVAFFEVENIGDGSGPGLSLAYQLEVGVFRDIGGIVPVYEIVTQGGEVAGGGDGQHYQLELEPIAVGGCFWRDWLVLSLFWRSGYGLFSHEFCAIF